MLGEAKIQRIKMYTNNEGIEKLFREGSYLNLEVMNAGEINLSKNLSSYNERMKSIIPYGNRKEISKLHYAEELAIMDSEYVKEFKYDSEESISFKIFDYSNEKFNGKDLEWFNGDVNIVTGIALNKTQLKRLEKSNRLILNMPRIEDCIECVKYFYTCFNSVHYFPEDFELIFENMRGKVIENIIVSKTPDEIIKYMNFGYEDKRDGVFISMYKGNSLSRFGEYMNMLEKRLHIGECTLFCNEYYNCESNDEYYLSFII
ncbi:MAG: hypothetical protein ACRC2K_00895 [Clostridium sp.]